MNDSKPFPEIWVVFAEGQIIGMYPNDESKAQSVRETLLGASMKADVVKYLAAEFKNAE